MKKPRLFQLLNRQKKKGKESLLPINSDKIFFNFLEFYRFIQLHNLNLKQLFVFISIWILFIIPDQQRPFHDVKNRLL